jgi:hypothetical protein
MIAAADSRAPTAAVLDGAQTRDPATVTERLLAVQAQNLRRGAARGTDAHGGLTAADLDRALTDERSLAVTWLNRGTLRQKQTVPKPFAKAKRDRRQGGAAHPKPAADLGASPERGRAPLASSHGSRARSPEREPFPSQRGPAPFAKTGRLVVESACSPTKGSCADLALDRHHHRCCVGHPWLLWPGTLLQVAAPG